MHEGHHGVATHAAAVWPLVLVGLMVVVYLLAAARPHAGRRWSHWRTFWFLLGAALLAAGLLPSMMQYAHQDLRGHMLQHLLIGMLAPLGLVLGAPLTLAWRTLPTNGARRLVAFLGSRPLRLWTHPLTAMLLNVGGMYLLYLTPLYLLSLQHTGVHIFVHLHFLLAGCLFTWVIAGPDPAPRRPRFATRLIVLFLSMAAHALLGKLMYIHLLPQGSGHGVEEIQAAAKLMYYGGDASELLLAVVLFADWYRRRSQGSSLVAGSARQLA